MQLQVDSIYFAREATGGLPLMIDGESNEAHVGDDVELDPGNDIWCTE